MSRIVTVLTDNDVANLQYLMNEIRTLQDVIDRLSDLALQVTQEYETTGRTWDAIHNDPDVSALELCKSLGITIVPNPPEKKS